MKIGLPCFLFFFSLVNSHSHEGNPAFKYSREANEDLLEWEEEIPEDQIIDLPTSHGGHNIDHGGHGHSHGGHGHSHGGHSHDHGGHSHDHGGHSHDHGGHSHDHGGHSHDHGGHSHDHGGHSHEGHGCHGHSHGSQRELTKEEREHFRKNLHATWDEEDEEFDYQGRWLSAIGATLAISIAPFFILFCIPLDDSAEKKWILKILLSFASGGLLGDAFLHLIPHASMASSESSGHGHSHSHGHSHGDSNHGHDMRVGLGVLSGIIAFLCVEKFVRILNGNSSHGHSHSSSSELLSKEQKTVETNDETKKNETKKNETKNEKENEVKNKLLKSLNEKDKKTNTEKEIQEKENLETKKDVKIAGFLNLAADCFHNFTDGLAIGASFLSGNSVGIITTLTILLHEVPHEIGDFAILIQSGVPRKQAIFLQLLTALGALAGCFVSLLAGGVGDIASGFILPFTAGGFIYIATVSVIPDLLEGSTWKQSLYELVALLLGVEMMVIIAQYE